MRNSRSALIALGLAGAAYWWRNKGKVQQQFNRLTSQNANNRLSDNRNLDRNNNNSYGNNNLDDARSRSL